MTKQHFEWAAEQVRWYHTVTDRTHADLAMEAYCALFREVRTTFR